jgi:hypothetical protein
MPKSLSKRASTILNLLPFAHMMSRTLPSPHLVLATAALRHPLLRRMAPRLTTVATVVVAGMAAASFVQGLKGKRAASADSRATLDRSSAT